MKFLADIEVDEGIKDKNGGLGADGQILSSTGSEVEWINAGTIGGSIADNEIAVGAATANTIEGSSNFSLIPLTLGSVTSARLRLNGRLEMRDDLSQGSTNLYIGVGAGGDSASGGNVGIGQSALGDQTTVGNTNQGRTNCALGLSALSSLTLGNNNVAMGSASLGYLTGTGQNDNTAIGNEAARFYSTGTDLLTQSSQGVYIGSDTRASANNISNEIAIGYGVVGGGSDTITLGNSSVDLLRIPGLNATSGQVLTYDATAGGFEAATPSSGTIGGSIADNQIAVGAATANAIEGSSDFTYTGSVFTVEGRMVLSDDFSLAAPNIFIGKDAGINTDFTGSFIPANNIGIGRRALKELTKAGSNIAIGAGALRGATENSANIAMGVNALFYLDGTGGASQNNTVIGHASGERYGASFTDLDFVTTGDENVFVGWRSRPLANNPQNQIIIGYDALGGSDNTITLGDSNITAFRIPGLGTTNGHVLTYSTADDGFILAASSGGTISGATVENQVSFGSATSSAITSVSTFTHTQDDPTEILSLGGTAIATRVQTVFKAIHRNASNARARYSLFNGTALKGYFQSSGTAGEIVLGSSAGDLVLQVESTHNITMASTSGTNVGIGLTDPKSKLDVAGGIKMSSVPDGDNTSRALIPGTFRYRTEIDGVTGNFGYSYVDMCMQTDNTVFTWTNIKTIRWVQ